MATATVRTSPAGLAKVIASVRSVDPANVLVVVPLSKTSISSPSSVIFSGVPAAPGSEIVRNPTEGAINRWIPTSAVGVGVVPPEPSSPPQPVSSVETSSVANVLRSIVTWSPERPAAKHPLAWWIGYASLPEAQPEPQVSGTLVQIAGGAEGQAL